MLSLVVALGVAGPAAGDKPMRLPDVARALYGREGDVAIREVLKTAERQRAGRVRAGDPFLLAARRILRRDPTRREWLERNTPWATTPLWLVMEIERTRRWVARALVGATGADGIVRPAGLRGKGGESLLRLAERLDAAGREGERHPNDYLGTIAEPRLLQRLQQLAPVSRPRMRALDQLVRREGRRRPFAGWSLLAVQHLLASTGGLLDAFERSGLRPDHMFLQGKRHSERDLVIAELRGRGAKVNGGPRWMMDVLLFLRYGEALDEAAVVAQLRTGRHLVVDDGGEVLTLVNDLVRRHPDLAGHVVGVEQTTKGARRLDGVELLFPVIDVARSWAKLEYEAPLIGHSVAKAVQDRFADLGRAGVEPPSRRVVVLGYGPVGQAVAKAMRRKGHEVEIHDIDGAARTRAAGDGFPVHETRQPALARAGILVSATGGPAVDREALRHLPDRAILFNAASPREIVRDPGADAGHDPPAWTGRLFQKQDQERPWAPFTHRWELLRHGTRTFLLAAEGLPVNFGGEEPIPARYIQLTRGLLYLGARQAVATSDPGLHPLARPPQDRLVAEVQRDLARTGESLLDPRF